MVRFAFLRQEHWEIFESYGEHCMAVVAECCRLKVRGALGRGYEVCSCSKSERELYKAFDISILDYLTKKS